MSYLEREKFVAKVPEYEYGYAVQKFIQIDCLVAVEAIQVDANLAKN